MPPFFFFRFWQLIVNSVFLFELNWITKCLYRYPRLLVSSKLWFELEIRVCQSIHTRLFVICIDDQLLQVQLSFYARLFRIFIWTLVVICPCFHVGLYKQIVNIEHTELLFKCMNAKVFLVGLVFKFLYGPLWMSLFSCWTFTIILLHTTYRHRKY